jgi:hypothetical protein
MLKVIPAPVGVLIVIVPVPTKHVGWINVTAGAVGIADTVTARLLAALVPQLLLAVTVMFPFCPAVPVVTVIELVILLPDQPDGSVQV